MPWSGGQSRPGQNFAVTNDEKNKNQQQDRDRHRKMSLVGISDLCPHAPEFTSIGEDRRKKFIPRVNIVKRSGQRALLSEKWDVRKRSEKEEENGCNPADDARLKQYFAQHHHQDEH